MWLIKWIAFYYTTNSCELIASLSRSTVGACSSWQLCRHQAPMGGQVHSAWGQLLPCACCCSSSGWQQWCLGCEGRAVPGEATEVVKWRCLLLFTSCAWFQVALHDWLRRGADPNYQPGYIATYVLKLILSVSILLIKTFSFYPADRNFQFLGYFSSSTFEPHVSVNCSASLSRRGDKVPLLVTCYCLEQGGQHSWLFHFPSGNSQFCGFCCMMQLMLGKRLKNMYLKSL